MLEKLNMIFTATNGIMWSYVLITMLISIGCYFTFRTGFVQLSMLREMFSLLKTNEKLNKEALSSFQAFCISTASRVGTGNIVGIAMAIGVGGPGAVF
jgi:AGCS family alanine or glycine:cation symporter